MKKSLFLGIALLLIAGSSFAQIKVTNEMIYQKLLEIEKRQIILEQRIDSLEKRFEEFKYYVDKRFEQVDKRFEQVDKRFEELRNDMNKRFEDMNKKFEQLYTFLWIITSIFTAIMVGAFGFAYWDRRTIIRKAKEETLEELQKEHKLKEFYDALKELAKKDPEVKKLLQQFNLL